MRSHNVDSVRMRSKNSSNIIVVESDRLRNLTAFDGELATSFDHTPKFPASVQYEWRVGDVTIHVGISHVLQLLVRSVEATSVGPATEEPWHCETVNGQTFRYDCTVGHCRQIVLVTVAEDDA